MVLHNPTFFASRETINPFESLSLNSPVPSRSSNSLPKKSLSATSTARLLSLLPNDRAVQCIPIQSRRFRDRVLQQQHTAARRKEKYIAGRSGSRRRHPPRAIKRTTRHVCRCRCCILYIYLILIYSHNVRARIYVYKKSSMIFMMIYKLRYV